MILRYELPKEAEQVISLTDNERIYYAVPVDIDDAGNFWKTPFYCHKPQTFCCGKGQYQTGIRCFQMYRCKSRGKNRWRTFSNQF